MSTQNVAREAFDAFFSADHDKCAQLLEQIGSVKGTYDVKGLKVAHNSLINEYYRSGCADPQQLLTQLTQVHDKARDHDKKEKSRRKRDDNDEEPYREDEDLSVLRYNQALLCVQLRQHAQATALLEDLYDNIEPIDDFVAIRISFLLLELYLLQREPEQALNVLAYLTKTNAFLTVMKSDRPKAGEVSMGDAENLEDGKPDAGLEGEADKVEPEADLASPSGDAAAEAAALASAPSQATAAEPAALASGSGNATDGDKADSTVQGPLPSLTIGSFLPRHGRAPDTISRAEYRFFCLMYRARIGVALRNMKSAKKDVKTALEVLEELQQEPLLSPHPHTTGPAGTMGDHGRLLEVALRDGISAHHYAMVLVLKAQFEYTRQNYRKAMKLLSNCQFHFAESRSCSSQGNNSGDQVNKHLSQPKGSDHEEGDEKLPTDFHPAQDLACATVFFNNMGCLHFLMHKPNLATVYFQKALQACHNPPSMAEKTAGAKGAYILGGKHGLTMPGVLCTKHWLDKRVEVVYNTGLQLLMCERPLAAFKCFQQCIPAFRTWPRLWLRLAECCIGLHWQALASSSSASAASASADSQESRSSSAGPVSWPREASRSNWSVPRSSPDGNGLGRLMVWDVHGVGPNCRWLLSTSRDPPLGRRGAHPGDEEDGEKKDERASSSGAPAAATSSSASSSFWDEAKLAAGGEGALSCAAMCLRNVLAHTTPLMPERDAQPAGGGADGAELQSSKAMAGANAASNSSDKAAGQMSRGAKVAGAASTDGGKPSASSGSRYPVRDVQVSLLEDVALVKLAYVSLCLHDYASAVRHCRRLLEKSHLLPSTSEQTKDGKASSAASDEAEAIRRQWTFQDQHLLHPGSNASSSSRQPSSVGTLSLAVLYLTEALCFLGRVAEAKALLGSFIGCSAVPRTVEMQRGLLQELERSTSASFGRNTTELNSTGEDDEEPSHACGGVSPASPLGGLTSPVHLSNSTSSAAAHQAQEKKDGRGDAEKEKGGGGKDGPHAMLVSYPPTEFPRLGDTQCMLYTNLAAVHVQDGNLAEAEKACKLALQARPNAIGPLRTLVYILLRKGQHDKALQRLRKSRMDMGSRSGSNPHAAG